MLEYIQDLIAIILGKQAERLAQKSENIFNVFTETVNRLESNNVAIEAVKLSTEAEIQTLLDRKSILVKTQESNTKMKLKITQFINE